MSCADAALHPIGIALDERLCQLWIGLEVGDDVLRRLALRMGHALEQHARNIGSGHAVPGRDPRREHRVVEHARRFGDAAERRDGIANRQALPR